MSENQTGRSMIEMIGVLAIIGVLSVGGIHGYTSVMEKYRTNRMQDEMQQLVMGVRASLDVKKIKTETDSSFWYDAGIFNDDNYDKATGHGRNMFDGDIDIKTYSGAAGRTMFSVSYTNVPVYACRKIILLDWDAGSSAGGLISIDVGNRTFSWTAVSEDSRLPLTLERALDICGSQEKVITWHFRQ